MITQKNISRRQQRFVQKGINETPATIRTIQQSALFPSQGSDSSVFAIVIEAPYPGDPQAEPETPEYNGLSHYTLRLTTDTTAAYNAATGYVIGNEVIASDNLKYTSLTGTVESPNTGNEPSASPTDWEQSEEIRIEYAMGAENRTGADIRRCVPAYPIGEVVEIISRVVSEEIGTRYYICGQWYAGSADDANILPDWNNEDLPSVACFR